MEELAIKPLETQTEYKIPEVSKIDLDKLIILYGQRVSKYNTTINTTVSLYKVPNGSTFFLYAITMSINTAHTSSGFIMPSATSGTIALLKCNANDCQNTSVSLPNPLIVNSNEELFISHVGTGLASPDHLDVCIVGYLVPNSIISQFL